MQASVREFIKYPKDGLCAPELHQWLPEWTEYQIYGAVVKLAADGVIEYIGREIYERRRQTPAYTHPPGLEWWQTRTKDVQFQYVMRCPLPDWEAWRVSVMDYLAPLKSLLYEKGFLKPSFTFTKVARDG